MSDQDLIPGPNSSAVVAIDQLPPAVMQAIYHAVTGKTENYAKVLKESVMIAFGDLERLYHQLKQQIDNLPLVAPPTVTVIWKTSDSRVLRHSSWERFSRLQTNTDEITSEVTLKLEFIIKPPLSEIVQRMVVLVNLDSSLPVIAPDTDMTMDPAMLDFLMAYGTKWRTCRISVDFVDYIPAENIIATIEKWFKALEKMPISKLNTALASNWRLVRDSIDATPMIGFAVFVLTYGYFADSTALTADLMLKALGIGLAVLSGLTILRGQLTVGFLRRLSHNIIPTVMILTEGDRRRYNDFKEQRASVYATIVAWLVLPISSAIINILCSYLYTYLTSPNP